MLSQSRKIATIAVFFVLIVSSCTSSVRPIQTIIPSFTPTVTPKSTLFPTNTPIHQVTSTPGPTTIRTTENSEIPVGVWYTKGNLSMTIGTIGSYKSLGIPYIEVEFFVKNVGSKPISFEYGHRNIKLIDNTQQTYEFAPSVPYSSTLTLQPGETRSLYGRDINFSGNYEKQDVEQITVIVVNLSSIEKAEWIIPIHH